MAAGTLTQGQIRSFYDEKKGILSWLLTTDHKRIGLLYLWTILAFFAIGIMLGLAMRLELLLPGKQFIGNTVYNSVLTLHGVIMIFLVIIPSIPAVFGNFILPLQLGTNDVMFPKINLLSWYCLVVGALIAVASLFWPSFDPTTGAMNWPAPDTGWTFYAPYSTETSANAGMAVFGAFVIGFSSIFTGLNFIATVHRMRAPKMTWFKLPLFIWALYATAWIQILATPVVAITLLLVIAERAFDIGLFDPTRGGDPIMFQHLFWIYSHPAVYVMILPAMGVVSEIIPTFCKKHIFGYKFIAFSSIAIAAIGSLVWGHHMFTTGMSDEARIMFSFLTFFVSIPSAVKVFNWIATMHKASIDMKPPMVLVVVFIVLFLIGGFTGLMQASVAPDVAYHDTYYIVAHFHYVMFGGTMTIFFAAMHYWYPKMVGKMYSFKHANISIVTFFVGFNLTYFPMFVMGHRGMPRRYYDYDPTYHAEHALSTVGSWVMVFGIGYMMWNILMNSKKPCGNNPWGGVTYEWETQSPPVQHNFTEFPDGDRDPYDYSEYAKEQQAKLDAEAEAKA